MSIFVGVNQGRLVYARLRLPDVGPCTSEASNIMIRVRNINSNKYFIITKSVFAMNKKLTNLFLGGALFAALAGTAVSCKDYDGDIDDLDARVEKLESTLKDLKAQISAGAVVTGVESVSNGVKVTLSDGKTFTLTNGKDGKDGANGTNGKDGKNGSVVTIGDNGNWFIDGKDTRKPSKGANGKDGKDGKDATQIYFVPNMETGMWDKVVVEPGKEPVVTPTTDSWKAAGVSGGVTAVWNKEEGTLTFANVDGSEAPVVIALNGLLRSIAFVPETMTQGLGVIDFYTLYKGTKFITSNDAKVTYRLNPENANVKDVKWAMIDREVKTKVAGDNNALLSIVKSEKAAKGGMEFVLRATKDILSADASAAGKQNLVALQATLKDEVIVSDYAFVEKSKITAYQLIHAAYYGKATPVVKPYPTVKPAITAVDDIKMVYNKPINVIDSLVAFAPEVGKALKEINVEPSYKVSLVSGKFLGEDNVTDQQKFVTVKDGVLSVNEEWLANGGRAAIGRTPLLEASAFVKDAKGKDVEVAKCYIKVLIVDVTGAPADDLGDMTPVLVKGKFDYADLAAAADPAKPTMSLTWDRVNAEILDVLGLPYDQFVAKYNVDAPAVKYFGADGKELTAPMAGVVCKADGINTPSATNSVTVDILNSIDENTSGAVNVTIPAKNNKLDKNVVVKFEFAISHAAHFPELNPDYLIAENTIQVKGRLEAGKWVMKSGIKEHFVNYLAGYEDPKNHESLKFALRPIVKATKEVYAFGAKPIDASKLADQEGAAISGVDFNDMEIALTTALEGQSKDYIVTMYNVLANGHYCQKNYVVRFVSPFVVEAAGIELKTFAATADTKDLAKSITIKDLDGKVVFEKGAVTEYGTKTYSFAAADFVPTYALQFKDEKHAALDTEESFGGRLTIAGSVVTWDNMGGTLVNDKNAAYTVKMAISNICTIGQEGAVKVLSVEHSK